MAKTDLKPINTPIYGYWTALYNSFYSNRLYIDVGKRWNGLGLKYLLFVIAIFGISLTARVDISFNEFFKHQITEPLLQLPVIYVQNGEASIDKPVPYLIKNSQNQVALIVDTSGTINDFSAKYPFANILINKDKLSYRLPMPQLFNSSPVQQNSRVPIVKNFSKDVNQVFDGKKLIEEGSLTIWKVITQIMMYPILIVMMFSFFMIMFAVIGLMGQVFARMFFSFQISYRQACRLLIVAGTPMMLLLFFFLTFDINFFGKGVLLIGVLLAYYSFAIISLKAESMRIVAP